MRPGLLARVIAWLFGSAVLSAALYWAFLNTPDSNAPMLGASALLLLLLVLVIAYGVGVASEVLLHRSWSRAHFRRPATALPRLLACVLLVMLLFWSTLTVDRVIGVRGGEISAWFMATFGWADVSALLLASSWLLFWTRWVLGPVLALSLFLRWRGVAVGKLDDLPDSSMPETGRHRPTSRVAAGLRSLALATLAFALLVYLPWQYGFWPLSGLPPTWVEPVVAGARIALVLLLMTTGVGLMMAAVVRGGPRRGGP